jgi:hypothetical protein
LYPPEPAFRRRKHLDLPPAAVGEALVHAKELAGEEGRLVAAGAGAHLHDGVAVVQRVARHQEALELFREAGGLLVQLGDFGAGHGGHLRIIALLGERAGAFQLLLGGAQAGGGLDRLRELRVLAREVAQAPGVRVDRGVRELVGEVLVAALDFADAVVHGAVFEGAGAGLGNRHSRGFGAVLLRSGYSESRGCLPRLSLFCVGAAYFAASPPA